MGRYSQPLASRFVQLVDLRPGQRVLDVGCGAGALTSELVPVVGVGAVSALDPSEPFVAAVGRGVPRHRRTPCRRRVPPFDDATFDQVLAQLVVHFMADPRRACARWLGSPTRRHGRGQRVGPLRRSRPPLAVLEAAREQDRV